jgi:hypothetical protein
MYRVLRGGAQGECSWAQRGAAPRRQGGGGSGRASAVQEHPHTGQAVGEQDGEAQPAQLGVALGEAEQREALLDWPARGIERRVRKQLAFGAEVAGGAVEPQPVRDLPQPSPRRAACELIDGGVSHRACWPPSAVDLDRIA